MWLRIKNIEKLNRVLQRPRPRLVDHKRYVVYSGEYLKKCSICPNTDYLISRAEATLGSVDKVKKGHADYLHNMGGKFASDSTWSRRPHGSL